MSSKRKDIAVAMAAKGCYSGSLKEWPMLQQELLKRGIELDSKVASSEEVRQACQRALLSDLSDASQASKPYPVQRKSPSRSRTLTLADFPRKTAMTKHTSSYLVMHQLPVELFDGRLACTYTTAKGICFVLYGELAYQERDVRSEAPSRFYNPKGVKLSNCIFLPDVREITSHLLIVEGPADALACYQAGFTACSILGSNVSDRQIELIRMLVKPDTRVVYIPDNDGPGVAGMLALFSRLPVNVAFLPREYKDLCGMPKQARPEFLRQAVANACKSSQKGVD